MALSGTLVAYRAGPHQGSHLESPVAAGEVKAAIARDVGVSRETPYAYLEGRGLKYTDKMSSRVWADFS
jgi:hypothetical protein